MPVTSIEFSQAEKEALFKEAMENCGAYVVLPEKVSGAWFSIFSENTPSNTSS